MTPSLDLFPIGNCAVSALIDRQGRFVWACAPRVDGDPVFSALMDGSSPDHGFWSVEIDGMTSIEQAYVRNTPVLRTVMTAEDGASCEIIDFAPRHPKHSRTYRPLAFARIVRPLSGDAAHSRAPAALDRLGRAAGAAYVRVQPHPLSMRRGDVPPHHRLPGFAYSGGAGVPAGTAPRLLPGAGRGL